MNQTNELIPITNPNHEVLFAPGGLDGVLERIERNARSIVADIATTKGRETIRSNAANVARAKTYLDDLGKDYVAKLKALPAQVDAERRKLRDRLDALRDEVRRPLTEYEDTEKRREALVGTMIADLEAPVLIGTPSEEIAARLNGARKIVIPDLLTEAQSGKILLAREAAIGRLTIYFEMAKTAEAEAAEAEQLRIEAQKRAQIERDERIAKEAAARATREAEERSRLERERQERERNESERKAMEAERRAKEADERLRREQAEAEERRIRAIEEATKRERERIEAEQAKIERDRQTREADIQNRNKVNAGIIRAISGLGLYLTDAQAIGIVAAIIERKIPRVSISY